LGYYGKALGIYLTKLGPDRRYVADSYYYMADVYASQDRNNLAFEYYSKALDIYLAKLAADHPSTQRTILKTRILRRKLESM
jgi:tetratricopeptide (TPR) repeat protein